MEAITITEVESTFKSTDGRAWKVALGPKTLLIGDNGDGKSAILQSLEAALLNEVDDLAGKNGVRDPSLLIEMAAQSDQPGAAAWTKAKLSNGDTAEWSLTRRDDGTLPQQPDVSLPKCVDGNVMPMRVVQAVLAAERKTAEKALLSWWGGTLKESDVLPKLPGLMHTRFREIAQARAADGTPLEQLLAVQSYGKTRVQESRTELTAAKRLVEGLASALGRDAAAPSEDEVAAMQQDVDALTVALNQMRAHPPKQVPTREQVQESYTRLQSIWNEGAAAGNALQEAALYLAQVKATPPQQPALESAQIRELHRAAGLMLELSLKAQSPQCFSCGLPGLESPQHVETLRAFHGERANMVPPEVARMQQYTAVLQEAEAKVRYWEQAIQRLQQQYAAAEAAYNQITAAMEDDPATVDGSPEDVERELNETRQRLHRALEFRGKSAQIDEARNQIVLLEEALRSDQAFFGAVDDVVKRLSDASAKRFDSQVQQYMPASLGAFAVDGSGTKRIRIGIRGADGQVRAATISGGQRIAMEAALAMAVSMPMVDQKGKRTSPKNGNGSAEAPLPLRVVTLPDRDISDATRILLMQTWQNWPGQVILTATDKPKGRIPSGWTVVNVRDVFPRIEPASTEPTQVGADAGAEAGAAAE